jgi:hypothetical protein
MELRIADQPMRVDRPEHGARPVWEIVGRADGFGSHSSRVQPHEG